MFLSKKTATNLNKPKNQEANKGKRVLGGWGDEDEEKSQPTISQKISINNKPTFNLLENQVFQPAAQKQTVDHVKISQTAQLSYYDWDALNERSNIEIEKGLVEEIVKPGGIRIKPNQSSLNDFLKEVKWLDISVIGSLLLSKIEVNYPFQVKAKALYTIEFIVKKNEQYLKYFANYAQKLRNFPEPDDNVQNYRKILKSVLNFIGASVVYEKNQEEKPIFIDPGYNIQPINDQPKSAVSNFIQENSCKVKKLESNKPMIGPGQNKPKIQEKKQTDNLNLLDFDITFQTKTNQSSLV